jgi:2-dehydro-3-deoxy-D-arabinonate dehydratase
VNADPTEPVTGLFQAAEGRWLFRDATGLRSIDVSLAALLGRPLAEARALIDAAVPTDEPAPATALPPVDDQEIWAAGVTYERSRQGRVDEAVDGSIYDRVYGAERPELFFKATAGRVIADGEPVGIRADSEWDAPEPELGVVVNSTGELFGYVVGNDMSSRSIEGANPLYLPQAKVYDRSCALGAAIVPAWLVDGPFDITLDVARAGASVFAGRTSTAALRRTPEELIRWLFSGLEFPVGVVILTGTGIVPGDDFTLAEGDVVTIDIAGVGRLVNPVTVVAQRTLKRS